MAGGKRSGRGGGAGGGEGGGESGEPPRREGRQAKCHCDGTMTIVTWNGERDATSS